jgi:hypothetical protein
MTTTETAPARRNTTANTTANMAEAGRELRGLLGAGAIAPAQVAQVLDGLSHEERVAAVRALGKNEQSRLWEAVDGFRPVALADIVPGTVETNRQVRHFGKNSLAMFTHFEKRFLRPEGQDAAAPSELHGYNFQESGLASWFSGPGYFVAVASPDRPEVQIDYRRLPASHPDGWPEIRSNEKGGGRLVYGFMVDTLRRVSEHVTIGRANRHGKDMNAWFLLCRDQT